MDSLRNFLGIFLLLFCILDLDEYSWVLASTNPSQDPKWTSNPSQDLKWTSNSTAENTENKQNRHHTSDANSTAVSSVQDGNINSFMPSLGTVSPKSASLAENSLVLGVDDRETINTTIQTITNFDLDEHSLARLLRALVRQELNECDLFILHDRSFLYSPVMKTLTTLPNSKKIVLLDETVELKGLEWTGRGCSGTLLLMTNPDMFIEYANDALTPWNYKAKVVVVGATKSELEILINTKKARKTESIVGLVKGMKPGHYIIYMNQLYWSSSLAHVTTWMGSSFTTHSQFFPDKISNLKRSKLNVITFEFPPSIIYQRDAKGQLRYRYGWEVTLVEELAAIFNFTVAYIEPAPGEMWGVVLPNGSWDGIVGLLGTGEGDLSIANIFISSISGRRAYQEFTTQFALEETCYLARIEPPIPRWQSLAFPFQLVVWLAILSGLLVSGPALWMIAKFSTKIGCEQQRFLSLIFSSLYSFAMHMRVPPTTVPARTSTQIYIVFLGIYALIVTTVYSSNLTAFLTVTRPSASMETFRELYEANNKVFSLGKFFKNSMANSKNEYLRGLAEGFLQIPHFEDIKPRVLSGEGVMIQSRSYLEYVRVQHTTPQGLPSFRIMKECFAPFGIGVAIQRNSPLKTKLDRAVSWMVEGGLVRRWFLDTIARLQKKHGKQPHRKVTSTTDETIAEEIESDSGVMPLSVEHMQGIFIILVIGHMLSGLVFLLEILVN